LTRLLQSVLVVPLTTNLDRAKLAGTALIESAVADFSGNGGCLALRQLAAALVGVLEPIGSDPAAVEIRRLWSSTTEE
jgi:hypothetical protein